MRTEEEIRERISQYEELQSKLMKNSPLYREYILKICLLEWVIEDRL